MKLATFNANSIRARMDVIAAWLREARPDVLCIQETKVTDDVFPVGAFKDAGYHVVFRGEKSYNGVALASRLEPADCRFGLDDEEPPDESRLVAARIGGVHVVNTYVPQGRDLEHPMYQYKLRWFARLREYFSRHYAPAQRLVWVGDLNVAPEPEDVHNPADQNRHVCFHEAVRRAFALTRDWGFVDVVRQHHPEPGLYTFFDYRERGSVSRNRGWRIDHVLATRPLARRCRAAYVDLEPRLGERPSDHTFVVADFAVTPTKRA